MASINKRVVSKSPVTSQGGPADRVSNYNALKRSVMSALLGENLFYEDGKALKDRITSLAGKVDAMKVAELAVDARENGKLRHVPLWLAVGLARRPNEIKIAPLLERIIRRPDEMGEFLSLLAQANGNEKRTPSAGVKMPKQVKLGLGLAFAKFNEYQLDKWKSPKDAIRPIDVLRMVHPKPENAEMAALWNRLKTGTLAKADTWEQQSSAGKDKKKMWTDFLNAPKGKGLGYNALLMNLRNMHEAGVDKDLVASQLIPRARKSWVLPFQYIAARNAVKEWQDIIGEAMLNSVAGLPRIAGKTVFLVDTSASMSGKMSRGVLDRRDAAIALAILADGMCEKSVIYAFSNDIYLVKGNGTGDKIKGFQILDAIASKPWGGTYVGRSVKNALAANPDADRIIVITDEQSADRVPDPSVRGYMVNVNAYQNGVGYEGKWTHVDGFSETIFTFISALENGVITNAEEEE
jgi:60 kDa SS-A/Ro ribonucleoprotein